MEEHREYKNVNERKSAPTEILAEFLTSIMLKDYEVALRYCTEILKHEPNNSTVKEFYSLILKKLEMLKNKELDNLSETSESDSICSSSDGSSYYNRGENTKSSSAAGESELSCEESDNDFRLPNYISSETEQTKKRELEILIPNTFRNPNQNNLITSTKKESSTVAFQCGNAQSSSILMHRTATKTIKRGNKSTMAFQRLISPEDLKKVQQTSTADQEQKLLIHATRTRTFSNRMPPSVSFKVKNLSYTSKSTRI